MKKNVSTRECCEKSNITELLCADASLCEEARKDAQHHLQECLSCRRQYQQLKKQYQIIHQELDRPVCNRVLDLAKKVRSGDTKYGLVLCEPVRSEDKSKSETPYRTKVVFTANGKISGDHKTLSEYDFKSLSKDQIAIRAMTDSRHNELLLYLWRADTDCFEGWELTIPGEPETTDFGPSGASKIALRDIEDLGDIVIYFKEKHNDSAS